MALASLDIGVIPHPWPDNMLIRTDGGIKPLMGPRDMVSCILPRKRYPRMLIGRGGGGGDGEIENTGDSTLFASLSVLLSPERPKGIR